MLYPIENEGNNPQRLTERKREEPSYLRLASNKYFSI